MATLKDIKRKISAVKKTKQITKAMNMVAASRLRGAQRNMEAFRPYAAKFSAVLGSLAENIGDESYPLLIPRDEQKRIHLILCTSDRGLCGGFNTNLISKADTFYEEMNKSGKQVVFSYFGKKGRDWGRKSRFNLIDEYIGVVGGKVRFNIAVNAGRKLISSFLNGEVDAVYIIYSEFKSMAKQIPMLKQIIPIPPITSKDESEQEQTGYLAEHICEPSRGELLGDLLPRSIYVQLFSALLETSTSEHAARMAAMDNATKACKDMIDNLTLLYNKARQSAITAELMDIVGGAEALKG